MSSIAVPMPSLDNSPQETAGGERFSPKQLRIAYLINQYPQPSHSFIRREIQALESLGHCIERFTIRRWNGKLVDSHDLEEQSRTTAVLETAALGLILGIISALLRSPRGFLQALAQAWRLGRRSDRGRLRNLVYFFEACMLLKLLLRRNIDHVHAHFGTNSTAVAMLCRLLGGPSFSFTVHGPEEFDKPEFLHLGDKIATAEFVVAISQFGRSQLLRQCPYAQWSKIQIVRCGVDAEFHDVEPTPPSAEPRLVCVARLQEQKGLPVLIDAAARLVDRGLKFQLKIIGDGPLRQSLESRIADLGLHDVVTLAGWKSGSEVRRALVDSRGMVLPSFAEGLPVVLMEALALHRPVVSTYVAGIPELVEDGVCGRLVPAGAVEPLADAMQAILQAPVDRLAAMGAAGAARTAERHCATTEAARLATLFQRATTPRCA